MKYRVTPIKGPEYEFKFEFEVIISVYECWNKAIHFVILWDHK